MASSSGSSSSSKRGISPGGQLSAMKSDKKWPSVDEYRYLAAGLLGQAPKMVKAKSSNMSNGDVLPIDRLEQNLTTKGVSMPQNEGEIKTMKNLAKEMGRMLAHAKTKGHTDELLQLFKSTLNNFVTDKHQTTTGSSEGSNYKSRSASTKRIVKPQLPQAKAQPSVQGLRKPAVAPVPKSQFPPAPPPSPSETRHGKQSVKTSSGEFTVMSDRERSVFTTTTVTRTKIREPMISVIESQKTNVLHRCYGKQSMKAMPLVYKNNKKTNVITGNNQRQTPMKARPPIKVIKPQKPSTNQQMRTIYENEQFDKSNAFTKSSILVKRAASSCSAESTERRPSMPIIKNPISKTVPLKPKPSQINDDSKMQQSNEFNSSDNSNTQSQESQNMCKTIQSYNSEQDNSLVQRLTTFWNKKLNANDKNSTSDISSTTSSTTYIINVNSDNSLGNRRSSSGKLSDESLSNSFDIENKKVKTSTIQTSSDVSLLDRVQGGSELPDIKVGLMDELIGVLKTKRNVPHTKSVDNQIVRICSNINIERVEEKNESEKSGCLNKEISLVNINDAFSNASSDCLNECTDDEIEDEYSFEETAAVDDVDIEDYDDDEDEDAVNPSYDEECDDETIEAIETCLMRTITVRNVNKSNYDDNDENEVTATTSEESCKECYRDCNDEDLNETSNEKLQNCIDTECCEDYKHIEMEQDCENDETAHIDDETNKLKDFGVTCKMNSPTGEADTIATTIMNVNDIIMNLRNLIFAIETIPEELKAMKIDLDSLPIPDKIKQTLSMMVKKDQKMEDNTFENLQSTECFSSNTNLENQALPIRFNQGIYYDNINNKTFGCCSREGSLFKYYIPSTFTVPILENVVIPTHMILFPKRNDYLKSRLTPIAPCIPQQSYADCDKFTSAENKPINGDKYTYVTRMMRKSHIPHFTVFYGTVAPNKLISAKASKSRSFQPHPKGKVTQIQDVTAKFTKERELDTTTQETYSVGLMCKSTDSSNSPEGWQINSSVKIICENDKNDMNVDANDNHMDGNTGWYQENDLNFVDICLSNELSPDKCQNGGFCNNGFYNSGRRRRFWRQNSFEEENAVQTGGGGDYNLTITPYACHRTSSMSVIVSNSVNDSNSLPDLHQIESERGEQKSLTVHPSAILRSQADIDLLSCDVIHEICEERLSEIDDCVMVEQHQSQVFQTSSECKSEISEDESKQGDNKLSVQSFNTNGDNNKLANNRENNILHLDQATSTTDLKITENPTKRNIGTMVNSSDLHLLQNFYNSGSIEDTNFVGKAYDTDYIVLCCKTVAAKNIHILEPKMLHNKYDLEVIFNNDPNLKQELSNLIDIENLCDKEKQLIAVCLMLLKRNSFVFENSLMRIILQCLEKGASSLWNRTSKRFTGKINKAKKKLIGKCQSQTQILISCHYRNLIKIIYTTLISFLLCVVIQKHFCGFSLPIRFPW